MPIWRSETPATWYYDAQPIDPDDSVIDIDRIYCLDWDAWTAEHRVALEAIYPELPGWVGYDNGPCWFGFESTDDLFLWASMEPPGLQVAGVVNRADWRAWHEAFLKRTSHLLYRTPPD